MVLWKIQWKLVSAEIHASLQLYWRELSQTNEWKDSPSHSAACRAPQLFVSPLFNQTSYFRGSQTPLISVIDSFEYALCDVRSIVALQCHPSIISLPQLFSAPTPCCAILFASPSLCVHIFLFCSRLPVLPSSLINLMA